MSTTETKHPTHVIRLVVAAVLTIAVVAVAGMPSQADHVPIHVEELTAGNRGTFVDDVSMKIKRQLDGHGTESLNLQDPSHVAIMRITVQPGARFPWHVHPGPVVVTVTDGILVYVQANDCVARTYPAGTSFIDTGENVHTAYVPATAGQTVLVATVLDAPASGPLTIPRPTAAADIAALDARCGTDTGAAGH